MTLKNALLLTLCCSLLIAQPQAAWALGGAKVRNIARVKGQEENVLRGAGLVIGVNGTGEANDGPTMRALSRAMELMGSPVSNTGMLDQAAREELKKAKNAMYVMVTATVPATGARRGDKLDCHVVAPSGKSLIGGRLVFAALQSPNVQDKRVFALCEGSIQVDDVAQPLTGRVTGGCQMEQDVVTKFISEDGWVTLVLEKNHADFIVADSVAESIFNEFGGSYSDLDLDEEQRHRVVKAVDAANIRVLVPTNFKDSPVEFVARLMEVELYQSDTEPEPRVVINPRTGSVVISGDVEIGNVIVTHKNVVVETGTAANFVSVDPGANNTAKLDRLVTALSNLKVPADDVIEIIRGIDRNGKLHGRLIIE